MTPSIAQSAICIFSADTLRAMSIDLTRHIETLRADDIRPSKGAVMAINEICAELQRRGE